MSLRSQTEREYFLGDLDELFDRNRHAVARRRSWLRETIGAVQLIGGTRRRRSGSRLKKGDSMFYERARDIRLGLRLMIRNPGFTTLAVVTIGLGIGATTAVFSVVDAVLLEPLPFPEPGRLMRPSLLVPPRRTGPMTNQDLWSVPKHEVFKVSQEAFSASAMYKARTYTLLGDGEPERIVGEVVESSYLGILGVGAVVGRTFTPDDDEPGAHPVVLLGHGRWLRRWGGDPSVVGRTLTVSGTPHTVIGVVPRGFKGLSGRAEVFLPFSIIDQADRTGAWNNSYLVVARLKDGVTPTQARADMEAVGRRIDEAFPTTNSWLQGWGVTARALNELRADPGLKTSILLLLGAVAFVLLIACVNLANLLLARTAERRREVAIRVAMGAGRARLVRQLMAECLVLAVGGAAFGLGLALLGVEGLRSLGPATRGVLRGDIESLTVLGLDRIEVDGTALLFTLVVALATGVLFGLAPALRASSPDLTHDLKTGGGWRTGSRQVGRLGARGALAVAELALAFVLLAGSGLMLRSLHGLKAVDLGFSSEGILTASVFLPSGRYGPSAREVFFAQLLERVGAIPGIQSVGMNDTPPVSGVQNSTVVRFFDRPEVEVGTEPAVDINVAGPGFFEALEVPLILGRRFDERDRLGEPRVVIVSERAANEFWPGEDPIGRVIGLSKGGGFQDGAEVVGVVGDVHYQSVEDEPNATAYVPMSQLGRSGGYLFVRVSGDPAAVAGPIRHAVRSMDPNVLVTGVRTMDERVAGATVRTRFSASLLSLFAAVALVLSTVGIFGVLSYLVAQQTRDIAIRMALGAGRGTVCRQILGRALGVTALGVTLGGIATLALTRFMGSLLFEVSPVDPTTLVGVALTLSMVSLAAAYLPVWRASRVEPLEVLKEG
jgi:predicted permease